MINNSLRKALIQCFSPLGLRGSLYSFSYSNNYRQHSSRSQYTGSYHQRSLISFGEFARHCELLSKEEQSQIVKKLKLLPEASSNDVMNFIKENKIQGNIFNIAQNFDFLPQNLQEALKAKSITSPSAIQQAIIPLIFEGHDVIAIAETGSGKTLAYALPGIMHMQAQPQITGPRILVLAPTRELAQQIQTQYDLFVKTCCLFGGIQKPLQYFAKPQTPKVIIATPGRLLDFIKDGLPLKSITQVVLDEADRMLDMGFEDQIRDVLKEVRKDRQTLFFSATWPKEVQRLANNLCNEDPVFLQLGERGLSVNKNITQSLIISGGNKFEQLIEYFNQIKDKKVLVFCQKKIDTQKLEYKLSQHGINARYLHGDLRQNQRDFIMQEFRDGSAKCLITTNLASRGLDVSDVDIVINYDFPENIEDYIHRIGRTGRAGKKGEALSFIEPNDLDSKLKDDLIKVFKQSCQEIPSQLQKLKVY
ncbi:unnamed protein product (macronuclear) [Paramecium tetraurelia]|uniref:RNA helicase n=1 Tax=Paramecium tetraurelia TaxID=5888 RepID=A0DCZ1_PARTE|nr:uncharacterized protein GSPATT00015767001 [Paramecium tetraurelia]CAK80908.1 unnamed protein product [Paramecium tetraurelia]|eukprot:XP_001448305.1 hypothetical protein (macronuclear) [Paramecium tetraurelia strain d4-2]